VKRVGNHLEGYGAVGQGRGLIDQLLAVGILDPELAQIGADAVDRASNSLRRSSPPAS